MSKQLFSCGPYDDLARAEKLMRENKVHRLPVIDENERFAGIISVNDIACEGQREFAGRLTLLIPFATGRAEAAPAGILKTCGAKFSPSHRITVEPLHGKHIGIAE